MPQPDYKITVERADSELLTIDGLAIARAFFKNDPSSADANSYDARAGKGNPARIEIADIETMNSSMRTRSAHEWWSDVVDVEFAWLEEHTLGMDVDILELDDEEWAAVHGDELAAQAFEEVFGFQRALARVGKVLHLKRPRFFPVLDQLTAEMLGLTIPQQSTKAKCVKLAREMHGLIRREGRRNLGSLKLVKEALDADGLERHAREGLRRDALVFAPRGGRQEHIPLDRRTTARVNRRAGGLTGVNPWRRSRRNRRGYRGNLNRRGGA